MREGGNFHQSVAADFGYDFDEVKVTSSGSVISRRISEAFTPLPKIIVSDHYPTDVLIGHELDVYLHFLSTMDNTTAQTFAGQKSFTNQIAQIGRNEYKKKRAYLEDNNFIVATKKSPKGKLIHYKLTVPPVYDKVNNRVINYSDDPFNEYSRRKEHFSFVRLPSALFECQNFKELDLSVDEKLAMFKLYEYYDEDIYGGIDVNAVRYDDGSFSVHPRLYNDLKLSHEAFMQTMNELVAKGLFRWKKVWIRREKLEFVEKLRYVEDEGRRVNDGYEFSDYGDYRYEEDHSQYEKMSVLEPYHMIVKHPVDMSNALVAIPVGGVGYDI